MKAAKNKNQLIVPAKVTYIPTYVAQFSIQIQLAFEENDVILVVSRKLFLLQYIELYVELGFILVLDKEFFEVERIKYTLTEQRISVVCYVLKYIIGLDLYESF
jgi:hypothetical protein